MIFVDTGIWSSASVPEDPNHAVARKLLGEVAADLVTTDYVVDELLTLLVMHRHHQIANRIGGDFWSQKVCNLVYVNSSDIASAWDVFVRFNDKSWSFTDCVSYAVMKRMKIVNALALDEHFKQFGFASVSP